MRDCIRFLRNGVLTEIRDFEPDETLLDYLRLRERKTGTKEGCNEGDCGACTVSLGRLLEGRLVYEPVNACILLLGQIDGADLITVDDLKEDGELHPVQQAMVDCHGSQCGFCTPGFVMTLFTMHHSGHRSGEVVTRQSINNWLAGNLCRCTGYRPIVDAAMQSVGSKPADALMKRWDATEKALNKLARDPGFMVAKDEAFFAAPGSVDELTALYRKHPEATIVSGATDVGLWVTKQLRQLPQVIWTGRAKGFDRVGQSSRQIVVGAGATYAQAFNALAGIDADMGEVLRRLGSRHVRASGTIGGNIANGSPIGDMPPLLIALGASLELRLGSKTRTLKLEDFFIDYGRQDRKPGELVTKIIIPKPGKYDCFRAYKISKRFDQDITAVLLATRLTVKKGRVVSSRTACGGMAGVPKRAKHAEAALAGLDLSDRESWERPVAAVAKDFTPLTDMRASADYRMKVAQNLLFKALLEISEGGELSRVTGRREAVE